MSPDALARTFLDRLNAGRIDEALGCLAPDFRFTGPFGEQRDRAELGAFFAQMGAVFTRYAMRIAGTVAEGGRVAIEAEGDGTLADGRAYRNRYHFLFETRDGAITAWREYCDTRAVAAAFGPLIP